MARRFLLRCLLSSVLGCAVGLVGCANYRDQLQRGQGYYDQNDYERALATLRHLEADQDSLEPAEFVRYCYLRGMTDYRLGFRADARYWLGQAQAASQGVTNGLLSDEQERLDETLTDLNQDVFISPVAAAETPTEPTEGGQALGQKCEWTSQCEQGYVCQQGACVQAD